MNRAYTITVALTTTTTTNILNGTITSLAGPTGFSYTNPVIFIRGMRVVNKTNAAKLVALWKDASGGNSVGKEFVWGGTATAGALDANTGSTVAANAVLEKFFNGQGARFDVADYVVGGASAAGCTLEIDFEVQFS